VRVEIAVRDLNPLSRKKGSKLQPGYARHVKSAFSAGISATGMERLWSLAAQPVANAQVLKGQKQAAIVGSKKVARRIVS